jgi:hypothetical protein
MNDPDKTPEQVAAAVQSLDEFSKTWKQAMDEVEKDSEAYWNGLSKEDQLRAFCAVSRRIHKGEIEHQGSYRYVLYSVFGFGPEAYAAAQMAGYLDIHNSIYPVDHEHKLLEAFCTKVGIADAQDKIRDFYL